MTEKEQSDLIEMLQMSLMDEESKNEEIKWFTSDSVIKVLIFWLGE